MKLSELMPTHVAGYLRIFPEDMRPEDHDELDAMLEAAKAIIRETTGNDAEACDTHPEFTIAALILCEDMYDNRTRYTKASEAAPNKTLEAILGLHDMNLI